jgi:hypothetical protein
LPKAPAAALREQSAIHLTAGGEAYNCGTCKKLMHLRYRLACFLGKACSVFFNNTTYRHIFWGTTVGFMRIV